MSDSESSSPEIESSFETTFVSSLAVYSKGFGKKFKETKSIKVKEFDFTLSADNYLEFLQEFLQSQSHNKFQVTAKKYYRFKYLYPLSKVHVIAVMVTNTQYSSLIISIINRLYNVVDVENEKTISVWSSTFSNNSQKRSNHHQYERCVVGLFHSCKFYL
jgi:hypothetical protein